MVCRLDTELPGLLICSCALWVDPGITQWLTSGYRQRMLLSGITHLKSCMIVVKHMGKKQDGKEGNTNSIPTKSFHFPDVFSNTNPDDYRNIKTTSRMSGLIICSLYIYENIGRMFLRTHMDKHIRIININLLEIQKSEGHLFVMFKWNRVLWT